MTLMRRADYVPSKRDIFDFGRDFFTPIEDSIKHFGDVDIWRKNESFIPAINVTEKENAYMVEAELPGLKKEDIDVSVKDNRLVIKGEKKFEREERTDTIHHVERSYGTFYRAVPFAKNIDCEKVNAKYENGILSVEVGKLNADKLNHRKVEIM